MQKLPYFEDEESKLHPDLPVVVRETINVVLWNPATKEVLCLDWEKFDWKTFIIGGVEKGENSQKAAEREIEEETGYTNFEFVASLGKYQSAYFASHKNENRIANTEGFLFKLKGLERRPVNETDLPHIFKWIPIKEVSNFINLSSQKYLWEKASVLLY